MFDSPAGESARVKVARVVDGGEGGPLACSTGASSLAFESFLFFDCFKKREEDWIERVINKT